jgi:uncharacterized protein YcfL
MNAEGRMRKDDNVRAARWLPAFHAMNLPKNCTSYHPSNMIMKNSILPILTVAVALLAVGCKSAYDRGPYLPQQSRTPAHENSERVVLLDPGVQHSITCTGTHEQTLADGRLEVTVQLRNRENRRLEVQANCVFKDAAGVATGDETPFQTVILTENATEQVKFTSMNNRAKSYTVRVRQAR